MYITYCRNQRSLNLVDTTQYRRDATAGEYRPTYLIRVSDWKKVPGKQVETGYCALSYVWEQSGDVVQKENGEYDCIDNGRHCIVEGYDINKGDLTTMTLTEEKKYKVQFSPSTRSKATIKHVTYEELLQQICKDFGIEYLWYDKICIDQSDHEIKLREIKQMHKIYGNACYTVAIVPEVHIHDLKAFDTIDPLYGRTVASVEAWFDLAPKSLWWKRSWTLEETMTSKRILMIGTDTHFWQHSFHTCDILTAPDDFSSWMLDFANQLQGGGSVNQALSQAHFRTSSKQHDKIYSLANIFPDMFKNMKISYEIDIKTTFNCFYRTIAIHDLSILCFGSNLSNDGEERSVNTMKNHNLPSWTGVSGYHPSERVTTTTTWLQHQHSICNDMLLHISTKYYKTLSVVPYDCGCFSPFSHDKHQWNQKIYKFEKRRHVKGPSPTVEEDTALIDWATKMANFFGCYATHYYQPQDASVMQARPLSLTEDCDDCIILPILLKSYRLLAKRMKKSPLLYLSNDYTHHYSLPVIKKYVDAANGTKERYKTIGIYFLGGTFNKDLISDDPDEILSLIFGDDVHSEAKEFIIQ
ncbi:heterokaryon incompatibility protein-domain-containing protein [Phascolomyces articulosus]|uniref:Heterokaryon incompatibility protein-domain-containing protein n=1 Tax=Phascolomyces articulosus TaxID=60185 RepID=A0AAD5K1H5_9FUNG|nr:heterokaryon incompatibility protein-domain-containing protein [Phascolomyces articulosus]